MSFIITSNFLKKLFTERQSFFDGASSVITFFPKDYVNISLEEKYNKAIFNTEDITYLAWKDIGNDIDVALKCNNTLESAPNNYLHKNQI